MRLYAATKNGGKLRELRALFEPYGAAVAAWDGYRSPEETADTYAGNAAIKARALHEQLRLAGIRAAVIADDSGLEIAALDGRPGVQSARYAGPGATWAQRRAALLREVAESASDDRRARFVCVLCFIGADGRELFAEGIAEGELSRDERGRLGFAYDPIFYDPSEDATFAELPEAEKNKISHRAKAVQNLMEILRRSENEGEGEPRNSETSGRSSAW
jgi:XTP/dITP diphosphohydrolase